VRSTIVPTLQHPVHSEILPPLITEENTGGGKNWGNIESVEFVLLMRHPGGNVQ